MSHRPTYDAEVSVLNPQSPQTKYLTWVQQDDDGSSSSEERGRPRLRGDGNLTLDQQQQQQDQTAVGSPTASSGRVSPDADPGGLFAAAPSIHRSRSRSVVPSLPIPIPGAAGSRRAAFRSAELAERLEGPRRWTVSNVSRAGGFSPAELSAQATRLHRGIGVGPSWLDPAGRLHQLPAGTRLPSPPPLTEEQLERARTLGAQPVPPYPLRPLSPGSMPVYGPITYAEYMRRVEERANEYRAF
ncbi:hypothetical protein CGRA01v4_10479 [Colletotrichum graminicola]|nr:hypothetical protein CGRA01v4_10479 [Colletotrichum graminicola]